VVTGPPKDTKKAKARAGNKKQDAIAVAAVLDSVVVEKDIPLLAGLFAFQDERESGTEIYRTITRDYAKHDNPDVHVKVSVEYRSVVGLPTADDRDMYMAFVQVANASRTSQGTLPNPIDVPAASMLRALGKPDSDESYEAIDLWMRRMISVSITYALIMSYKGRRRFDDRTSSVFHHVCWAGRRADGGSRRTDRYSVEIGDWVVDSINQQYRPTDAMTLSVLR
jgi:hypothetical protein